MFDQEELTTQLRAAGSELALAAADEIERLRGALAWYAAPIPARTHWLVNAKGERISDMSIWGDRARDALSPSKEPK